MVCQFENGMVWYDVPWKLAQFFYFSSGLKRSQENLPYHFSILGLSSDPVTSEAGARRPRSISNLYLTPWHVGPTWLRYVVQYHVARVLPTWGCALRVATERGAKSIFSNTPCFLSCSSLRTRCHGARSRKCLQLLPAIYIPYTYSNSVGIFPVDQWEISRQFLFAFLLS
jgi:hypothetical protein